MSDSWSWSNRHVKVNIENIGRLHKQDTHSLLLSYLSRPWGLFFRLPISLGRRESQA